MGGSGDAAEKTQEQIAIERRQRMQLDEETAASERRLKATARGKLGKKSLLSQPMQPIAAPKGLTITEGYEKGKGQVRRASDITAMEKVARRAALRIGG